MNAKEFLKNKNIDDRVLNREDLPEFWVSLSQLLDQYKGDEISNCSEWVVIGKENYKSKSGEIKTGNFSCGKWWAPKSDLFVVDEISVFIVVENDEYGRDLFVVATTILNLAESEKKKEPTRTIHTHIFSNDKPTLKLS